jgi:TetR/AcrR family transcriptional repressor of nem operon
MSKGEETRQFIIERSAPIFNTKGIAATAMSDIMEATQLSKGSLYVHFENKDVLAGEAVDYNLDTQSGKIRSQVEKQRTAKDKLFAFVDTLSDPLHPPVTGGCPIMNFGLEADDTNPAIKNKVNRNVEQSEAWIAEIIKQGIKAGEFKAGWNYREFATVMFAMIEGGVMICRIAGNNTRMKAISSAVKKMITEQLV